MSRAAAVAVAFGLVAAAALAGGCAHQEPAPPPATSAPPPVVHEQPKPADDGLRVAGTLGTLGDDEIAGPFQRAWDDITRCYDQASAHNPYLGGRISVKLRIDKSGQPEKAFVSESTFGNYDAERCVLDIARTLHFDKPHGGNAAEFSYPIEFRAKKPVQTWDEGRVSPSLARHKHEVAACRAQASEKVPPSVSLTVYVAPGGKITSAGMAADAPLDDRFASCLVGKARAWRLDDPLGHIAKATATTSVGKE
jgi:TonB family protein